MDQARRNERYNNFDCCCLTQLPVAGNLYKGRDAKHADGEMEKYTAISRFLHHYLTDSNIEHALQLSGQWVTLIDPGLIEKRKEWAGAHHRGEKCARLNYFFDLLPHVVEVMGGVKIWKCIATVHFEPSSNNSPTPFLSRLSREIG